MRNNELINGISAVEHVISAYRELEQDVDNVSAFESATEQILCTILNENSTLTSNNFVGNADGQNLRDIGYCRIPIAASSKLSKGCSIGSGATQAAVNECSESYRKILIKFVMCREGD